MKKLLILALLGLGALVSCDKKEDVNPNKSVKIVNFSGNIEVHGYLNGNAEVETTLESGQSTSYLSEFLYRVTVKCLDKSRCGYSVNGITYTQSKNFLKGVDYHE